MNNINRIISLKGILLPILGSVALLSSRLIFGEAYLVKNGKPCADIVISDSPARAVKLASAELQTYLEKISGAKLAITNAPGSDVPAHIYVGRSEYTDKLNILDEGLKYGAFRMLSGKDYLVLLGHDKDFVLSEYADHRYPDPQALKAWDARTGEHWGNPLNSMRGANYRGYSPAVGLWELDERGSLNAVYDFLRGLGVRWYMPGDLGEIIPKFNTLTLPPVDKTVKPDFSFRHIDNPSFIDANWDGMMYKLRSGVDATLGIPGSHGLANVLGRAEVKQAHPEFYANHLNNTYGSHACFSSQELVDYTVKYARTVFDIYPDLKYLSIWPGNEVLFGGVCGLDLCTGNMCQCDLCKGKNKEERGTEGDMSDYVWGFTERVARELYKTHPDQKLVSQAYGSYSLPPENIAKFSPNVMVGIVQPRCYFNDPEVHAHWLDLRKGWLDKLAPGNLYIYCHYLSSEGNLPAYFPHAIAEDLHSLKGRSQGDFIELTDAGCGVDYQKRGDMHAPGFNHLNMYVTTRFYWDADQDIEALLNEYYEKFYGPAAKEMKAFIDYSEANWTKMSTDAAPISKALELLDTARKAAGDTVYGKRIALVVDYCAPMTKRMAKLAKGRNKDLQFTAPSCGKPPGKLDGKLDKAFWKDLPEYSLVDLKTGQVPTNGLTTTFRVAWCDDKAVYFGIRCEEPDIKGLNISTHEHNNPAVWDGDNIDLNIETQRHSYYQIAFGPNGVFVDADRKKGTAIAWNSGTQAAGYVGDGYWSLELRVPVAGDDAETTTPLIGLAGHKPTAESPWYFNLGRQRVRGQEREFSASAPPKKDGTGGGFHDLWNYGQLIVK